MFRMLLITAKTSFVFHVCQSGLLLSACLYILRIVEFCHTIYTINKIKPNKSINEVMKNPKDLVLLTKPILPIPKITCHGTGATVGPAGATVLGDLLVPSSTDVVDAIHIPPVPRLQQLDQVEDLMGPRCTSGREILGV